MFSQWSRRMRWVRFCVIVVIFGCGPPSVREDRTIQFSPEGSAVAFQHGDDGVFIASTDDGSLHRIHDAADAIATSTPLWSPSGDRLIFTTAHAIEPATSGSQIPQAWDADPEGRWFRPQPVAYRCWLRSDPEGNEQPEPSTLFSARCDHPGYIAANLAVRWHPDGERILFLDQVEGGGVSLFEFDPHSASARQLIEHHANAILFDRSPDQTYLTCSLMGIHGDRRNDGIWVRPSETGEWWRVPQSDMQAEMKSVARLEQFRETQPAWDTSGRHFAFVRLTERDTGGFDRSLFRVDVESRTVTELYKSDGPIRHLRWHPDSKRLAFVEGTDVGRLRLLDEQGIVSVPISELDVRTFAGWNHDGTKLAYVAPQPERKEHTEWVFLFPSLPNARDRVFVAGGDQGEDARVVYDDVRITFPKWSPARNELSLWGTYSPTNVSWLSMFVPWSLRPGDPAAILDCDTGQISWKAVNRHEYSQVGHYYLLKRDYERAWHWYQKAAENRPPVTPLDATDLTQMLRQRRIYQNPLFFEYYCLSKLGRANEANERLAEFRESFRIDWDGIDPASEQTSADIGMNVFLQQLGGSTRQIDALLPVIESLYVTEIFFSLRAFQDGADFFERQIDAAPSDLARLAHLGCRSQLLLANGSYEEYADLVTAQLAPLWDRLSETKHSAADEAGTVPASWDELTRQSLIVPGGFLAVMPMASTAFSAHLPQARVAAWVSDWRQIRKRAGSEPLRTAADRILLALLSTESESHQPQIAALRERIEAGGNEWYQRDVDEMIREFRQLARFR